MTEVRDLHNEWMSDPAYRREFEALGAEFARIEQLIRVCPEADLSHKQSGTDSGKPVLSDAEHPFPATEHQS
jgi:hypothetical protein